MQISTFFKGIAVGALIGTSVVASAGNIPQYAFKQSKAEFAFLENATPVNVTYGVASEMVYPDRQTINAYTGKGFPIGFDFKYGGRVFNQFAINNNGSILLGEDKVAFRGYCNLFFDDASRYASNEFYMGIMPSSYGIKEGEISYKLDGEEGNRTLTVQFAHLGVNEGNPRGNAIYSLQIVLSEKESQVSLNFLEEESPYSSFGLICGLYGWSNDDSMLITSPSMSDPATVSTETVANMLQKGALLGWSAEDALGYEHDDPYCYAFTFDSTGAPDFVCEAPGNLFVDQDGNTAIVTCTRPADAPATAILISEKPIETYPEQGVTYPVYNDEGELVTKFGEATLIYYGDDDDITAYFPNLKASTPYYIQAIGVNGYPWYSTGSTASIEFISSHPAPYVMRTYSANHGIRINTMGDDDIVIAATVDRVNTTNLGATGIFGHPEDNCSVGDIIEKGGEIIYIGPAGDFTYEQAEPNRQIFFRAWSVRDGRVSKTYINASGVTNPEMPYEPQLELYTLNEVPLNWVAQSNNTSTTYNGYFVPRMRGENETEPALAGVSGATTSTLISPTLNFGAGATLKFEWAMETARDYEGMEDQMVVLPEGNKPGVFGTGHEFKVYVAGRTNTDLFVTNRYDGTMMVSPNDADHFISGTSEFIPVSITMPEGVTNGKLTFTFSTEGFSTLYLRYITVTNPSGVETVVPVSECDVITATDGAISILSVEGGVYDVYSVSGMHTAQVEVCAGETATVALSKGVYLINGQKYIVK
ncbi:MAG: hypothetical protein K2H86_07785 [Muribaculaceae bacterium]|nr:hypothetical protein [Muribaculaceae bacterium]